jgi:type IV pilus assembly protein PilM
LSPVLDPIRRLELEHSFQLRPSYPPVAIELDQRDMVLVRLKPSRRARPVLEAFEIRPLPEDASAASMTKAGGGSHLAVGQALKALYESTGTRPGKVSLVLPDNLAKISIVTLPERPVSRKQLLELLRFKLRRSIPFKMEEANLTYQLLPGEGKEVNVLVAVMLRSVVEQYEQPILAAGAKPGVVDLATSSLFNLFRPRMEKAAHGGRDVALLNCVGSYFTLMIVRGERLVFFRCKSFTSAAEEAAGNGVLARELMSSLSYYEEKLEGKGIATIFVRSVARPVDEVAEILRRLGLDRVEAVDAASIVEPRAGLRIDDAVAQRLAPALGATVGRAS